MRRRHLNPPEGLSYDYTTTVDVGEDSVWPLEGSAVERIVTVRLKADGAPAGHATALVVVAAPLPWYEANIHCWENVQALIRENPRCRLRTVVRVRNKAVHRIPCAVVAHSDLNTLHRGQGLGKRMYLDLAVAVYQNVGPCLFMPDMCIGGETSVQARLVWRSLYRRFPHHGMVIALVKKPSGAV